MALGHGGRFFSQLAFLLRRGLTIREALDLLAREVTAPGWPAAVRRIAERLDRGEALSAGLSEFPPPFPQELPPFVEEMEVQGLLLDEADVLAAWPDSGASEPDELLARSFAYASILLRRGAPISEALGHAARAEDPESLKAAMRSLSKASILDQSLADIMGDHPRVFSPAVRRMVLQMERNGDAAAAFREIGLALARGWFPPAPGPEPGPEVVGILEDDLEGRQPQFRQAVAAIGTAVPLVMHDNAPDFVAWLEGSFASIRLLSLDHDLGPNRRRNGESFDPGSGMQVVDALVKRKASFPVLVHSSNPYDAPTMVRRLEEAGWNAKRIVPWGEAWIPTAWLAAARASLGAPRVL
jgi:hypothetical protein